MKVVKSVAEQHRIIDEYIEKTVERALARADARDVVTTPHANEAIPFDELATHPAANPKAAETTVRDMAAVAESLDVEESVFVLRLEEWIQRFPNE